jgi:hypothetical protein
VLANTQNAGGDRTRSGRLAAGLVWQQRRLIVPLFDGRQLGNTQNYGRYDSPLVNAAIDQIAAPARR